MNASIFILFFGLLFPNLTFGETISSEAKFSSRNMPSTCEYVFSVESDIKLELPLDTQDDVVYYQLKNVWQPYHWTGLEPLPVKVSGDIKLVELSLISMSIPYKYLYRDILIHFPKAKITCAAEFGRKFGEACMGNRSETPWRARALTCEVQQ